MKNVSEAYLNKMQSNLRTFIPRMTIDGVELDGDIQAGLSITLGSCGTQQFAIGNCFIPTMTAALTGCSTHVQDREILLEMGLVLDDVTVEYTKVGYFTAERPATDKFQNSFTAYGRLASKAGGVYISELAYPATISSVLAEITLQTGLHIVNNLGGDGVINTAIVGETYREALMRIAGLLGGFVTENGDGDVVIAKYQLNKAVTVDTDFCYSYPETNDLPYEVTGIEVVASEGGKDDEGNDIEGVKYSAGETANIIIQNPYMTAELFETCASNVVGFSYMPGKVEFLGDIRLEPWDSIVVTDEDPDAGIDIPCMNITHVWDGGLVTTVEAPGKTDTESKSYSSGPMSTMVERMYHDLLLAKEIIAKKVSVDYLRTNYATIVDLDATNAYIRELESKSLTVDSVDAKVAEIVNANIGNLSSTFVRTDKLNVDKAWINDLLVKGGILTDDISAATGQFTQYLTGVKIYGDLIKANTLKADALILQGADGIYRRLNIDSLGQAVVDSDPKYNRKIDGSVLVAESITAERIATNTITSQQIAAGTIKADRIDTKDLFAQNIEATGTIKGVNLVGAQGEFTGEINAKSGYIGPFCITDSGIYAILNGEVQDFIIRRDAFRSVVYQNQNPASYDDSVAEFALLADGRADLRAKSNVLFSTDGFIIRTYDNRNLVFSTELSTGITAVYTDFAVDGNVSVAGRIIVNGFEVSLSNHTHSEYATSDRVTSSGYNDGWYYQKWASGKVEAWKQYNITITGWSAWGSLYEATPRIGSYSIPSGIFTQTPNFVMRAQVNGIGLCGYETYGTGSATSTPQFWMLRPNNPGTTGMVMVLIEAIGR